MADAKLPRRAVPWAALVLSAVSAAHGWETARLFPTWASMADDAPVVMVDHAIHLYHGALGSTFLRQSGRTWGYDPFFMAGYPETPVWDSSSNLSIAFQAVAGGGYRPSAYKVGLILCGLFAWGALPLAARAAGLKAGEAATAGVVAFVLFWGGVPSSFWRTGMFAFVTASAAFPLVLTFALMYEKRRGRARWALLTASGAVWLFAHVTAPILAAAALPGFVAAHLGASGRRALPRVFAAAAVAAALNAFWLVPLWAFRNIRAPLGFFLTSEDPYYLWTFYTTNRIDGAVGLTLLTLGLGGLVAWWSEPEGAGRARALTFGSATLLLLGLTALGGLNTVTRTLEPFRFLATLDMLLVLPASSLVARLAGRRGGVIVAVGVGVALVFLAPRTVFGLARGVFEFRPLVVGLRPADGRLIAALRRETDGSARVLFEDQLRLLEEGDPESTHWTPLLPLMLGQGPGARTFVGGLYQTAFITHHHAASFGDYGLGGRPVDAWSPSELDTYFRRYNVGWVVCWSPLSRFVFDSLPGAKRVGTVPRPASPGRDVMPDQTQWRAIQRLAGPAAADRYLSEGVARSVIYRLDRAHDFALEGKAAVASFGLDRVELTDLEPDPATGHVTVSLHWLDTWRADPPVSLVPARLPGDPVPLVRLKLDRALRRLVLTNGRQAARKK